MKMCLRLGLNYILIISIQCFSQNLVPNPGFEKHNDCPVIISNADYFDNIIQDWKTANLGTPDYFNRCGNEITRVPDNWADVAEPKSGNGYIGIHIWNPSEIREYIQAKLITTLDSGKLYKVEISFFLSTYSKYAADDIGVNLSSNKVFESTNSYLNIKPRVFVKRSNTTDNAQWEWQTLADTFRAEGNEKYITIGNFKSNYKTKPLELKSRMIQEETLKDKAYYFIDDISVEEIKKPGQTITYLVGKPFVINSIQFEYRKAMLKDSALIPLKSFAKYLTDYPELKLEIAGYTDTIGGKEFNLDLSTKRAKAVSAYLIINGVLESRMLLFGYGSDKPVETNTTEIGRSKNRRVEFLLQK